MVRLLRRRIVRGHGRWSSGFVGRMGQTARVSPAIRRIPRKRGTGEHQRAQFSSPFGLLRVGQRRGGFCPSMVDRAQLMHRLMSYPAMTSSTLSNGRKPLRGAMPVMASQCSSTRSQDQSREVISFSERANASVACATFGLLALGRHAVPAQSLFRRVPY